MARTKLPASATAQLDSIRTRINAIADQLNTVFIDREDAIRVITLAYLTKEHYMLVGDPGTAKSALATRFQSHITGARYFKVLCGSFTPPEKIFGALDIKKFQAGEYAYVTKGMMPSVEFGFMDEALKLSEGCGNETLGLMQEREFMGRPTPLMTVGSATNWPEFEQRSDMINALHDRTLLRCVVNEITDPAQEVKMLKAIDQVDTYTPTETVTLDEIKLAIKAVGNVTISDSILERLVAVRHSLAYLNDGRGGTKPGISISGRRIGKLKAVLRAAAWLDGRDHVTVDDFEFLRFGMWNDRADVEVVNAALQGIDTAAIQQIGAIIDRGMGAIRGFSNGVQGPANLSNALKAAASAAHQARNLFMEPVFTKAGRAQVAARMQEFKDAYKGIVAQAQASADEG